jgi:hypothetical protein
MIRVADPSRQQWEPRRISIYHPEARPAAAIQRAFVESATTIEKVLTALAVLVANVSCEEYFLPPPVRESKRNIARCLVYRREMRGRDLNASISVRM